MDTEWESLAADGQYVLKLYVTGLTPRSQTAIQSIKDILEKHLPGRYELQVVDIYQHPEAAAEANLLVAPTLIKQLPLPLRRLVGDLSDTEKVLVGLDLTSKEE